MYQLAKYLVQSKARNGRVGRLRLMPRVLDRADQTWVGDDDLKTVKTVQQIGTNAAPRLLARGAASGSMMILDRRSDRIGLFCARVNLLGRDVTWRRAPSRDRAHRGITGNKAINDLATRKRSRFRCHSWMAS